jgi:phytoene dehydrogenase-like protein
VIKQNVADQVLQYFTSFATNITKDKILAEFHQSPLDIERMNPAMWRGSVHALAYGPAQSGTTRPVSGWGNYRMPINGLYQTGGCTAPGGSITGRPGRNCAEVLLKDLGTSIEEVVG